MKTLIETLGTKGGIGKSTFSIYFAEKLLEKDIKFKGIDGDNTNATFYRYMRQTANVVMHNIDSTADMDFIINQFATAENILIDNKATSFNIFQKWIDEVDLFNILKEIDTQFIMVATVGEHLDILTSVKKALSLIGDKAKWVIVKNQYNCTAKNGVMETYENSNLKQDLQQVEYIEVSIPILNAQLDQNKTIKQFLEDNSLTPKSAIEAADLPIMAKQRLITYQREIDAQLDKVFSFIFE